MNYIVSQLFLHDTSQGEDNAANEERAIMVLRPVTAEAPAGAWYFRVWGIVHRELAPSVFEGCYGSMSE